ncbi:tripartite tricarboxylate transporter TctB family protein [Ascidiaceihabitans sp.]|uniref:tripartite tricarboxylate transporter TctB family protein n=1 Tax=Ascidiaceihabitans sp. TaxID=1872644 RepID=UPI003299CA26
MSRVKTLQSLFKRYRRPGDIVFAWVFLIGAVFLLSEIFDQTAYKSRGKLAAQPRFWPAVSLGAMTLFAAFHLLGSALSERIDGRWREVLHWVKSIEYAGWFIVYAAVVPYAGYLPTTIIFAVLLALRSGYRSAKMLGAAAVSSFVVVVLFKTLLKVNLPAGRIYEVLPDGVRQIMLTYF